MADKPTPQRNRALRKAQLQHQDQKASPRALFVSLLAPIQRFLRVEATGGVLLMATGVLALLWANSPWAAAYFDLWEKTHLSLGAGSFALDKPLILWVNDGLMAIFFFLVGLEIKREMLAGELSSMRGAALPVLAALAGMAAPAAVYLLVVDSGPAANGWAIPMATDIAFSLGVLMLLGKRVPLGLKVFLTAFAIVDDLGSVIVIVLKYSHGLDPDYLLRALMLLGGLLGLNLLNVRFLPAYVLTGLAVWYLVLKSGIHPTVAGVFVAALVPARPHLKLAHFQAQMRDAMRRWRETEGSGSALTLSAGQLALTDDMARALYQVQSPAQRMEHQLHPWVAYCIMPVFALANAGVDLRAVSYEALFSPITLGVVFGLLVGKTAGIFVASWGAVRLGLGSLPAGMNNGQLLGASVLGGVGFTMSLFIATLSFPDAQMLLLAKLGIFTGSILAGILGYQIVRLSAPRQVSATGSPAMGPETLDG